MTPVEDQTSALKVVLRGAQLGSIGKPITFLMTSEVNRNPFFVDIICVQDSVDNDSPNIVTNPITGNRVTLEIRNPKRGGTTFSKDRQQVLYAVASQTQLLFSFVIIQFEGTSNFLIYYEFCEEFPMPANPAQPTMELEAQKIVHVNLLEEDVAKTPPQNEDLKT